MEMKKKNIARELFAVMNNVMGLVVQPRSFHSCQNIRGIFPDSKCGSLDYMFDIFLIIALEYAQIEREKWLMKKKKRNRQKIVYQYIFPPNRSFQMRWSIGKWILFICVLFVWADVAINGPTK